jgi:L-lysine exporter family protein LysE/ArgO
MTLMAVLEGSAFCAGTAMGAASILSVGPNNIMLMREGVMRGRVGLVASTVWASYLLLLVSALVLTDKIATNGDWIRHVLSWLGLVAISWFAFSSFRSYFRSGGELQEERSRREKTADCLRRVLTLVWLNPLTYVELLFIPAAMGGNFIMPICRILFISGLIMMATAACFGYGFGGGLVAPLFRKREMIRLFDLSSGVILSCMACIMAVALAFRH